MRFENKNDEFLYWAKKAEQARGKGDKQQYLICLNKAKQLLDELKEKSS